MGLVWYTFGLERLDGKKGQKLGPYQLTVYDGERRSPAWFGEGRPIRSSPTASAAPVSPSPRGWWAGAGSTRLAGGAGVPPGPERRDPQPGFFFGGDLRASWRSWTISRAWGWGPFYFCPHL